MRTALQIELNFDQVLDLVKQLPKKDKIKLSKELEKDRIENKLNDLLKTLKTKELSVYTINQEVDKVRQQLYISMTGICY